jgi:hypothetical protein
MANLTMDEVWHGKNYFVTNMKLRLDELVPWEMTYLDLTVLVSIKLLYITFSLHHMIILYAYYR